MNPKTRQAIAHFFGDWGLRFFEWIEIKLRPIFAKIKFRRHLALGFKISGYLQWVIGAAVWLVVLQHLWRSDTSICISGSNYYCNWRLSTGEPLALMWALFGGVLVTLIFNPIAEMLWWASVMIHKKTPTSRST